MILTICVAALAACGVFLVVWAVFEALLTPLPERTCHVLYLQGPTAAVEQHIRTCLWLRERRGMRGTFYFVDCGLEPEARDAARLLLQGRQGAVLCSGAELLEHLEQENRDSGSGTDQRDHRRCGI